MTSAVAKEVCKRYAFKFEHAFDSSNNNNNNNISSNSNSSNKNKTAWTTLDLTYIELNALPLTALKDKCRLYGLPVSGNKNALKSRVLLWLTLNKHAVKVQAWARKLLAQRYVRLHGPAGALSKRSMCVNTADFLSLDELSSIPFHSFFSFQDKDGFVYGFHVMSLYHLMVKQQKEHAFEEEDDDYYDDEDDDYDDEDDYDDDEEDEEEAKEETHSNPNSNPTPKKKEFHVKNPFNQQPLSSSTLSDLNALIRFNVKVMKYCCPSDLDLSSFLHDGETMTLKQKIQVRAVTVFQHIDALGNYTNHNWLLNLSDSKLMDFLSILGDIWSSFMPEVRRDISPPPLTNPFMLPLPMVAAQCTLQEKVICIIEHFTTRGVDKESQSQGAWAVLSALTLVSHPAACALPWLFSQFVS